MKKRVLSALLAAVLVLGSFTFLGAEASAANVTLPAAQGEKSGAYVDLYVKDGLLALFTAFDAKSESADATSWQAEDLYDMRGYEDYIDTADYTATLSRGKYLGWKWENGYLSHYVHTAAKGNRGTDEGTFLNLDALGTGSVCTVQEVYQLVGSADNSTRSIPKVAEDTVLNYSKLLTADFLTGNGGTQLDDMHLNLWYFPYLVTHGKSMIGAHFATITNYTGNNYFIGDYYAPKVEGLKGDNGTDLSAYYVSDGTLGVIESSILREGSRYTVNFRHGVTNNFSSATTESFTSTVEGTQKRLRVLIGMPSRAYSVRVYNKVLSVAEMNQNHLADLCGFYEIDATKLLNYDAERLLTLADSVKYFDIAKNPDKTGEEYISTKAKLDLLINPPSLDAEEREKTIYDGLYVGADGYSTQTGGSLVALFSAYGEDKSSVDLNTGIWYNKVSTKDASFVGGAYGEKLTSGWKMRSDGGVGYDLTIAAKSGSQWMLAQENANLLSFDATLLASVDFTVEYNASFLNYKLADGGEYGTGEADMRCMYDPINNVPTDRIGYLGNYATRAGSLNSNGSTVAENGSPVREIRWFVGLPGETFSDLYAVRLGGSYASGQSLWRDYTRQSTAPYVQSVTRDENEIDASAAYSVYADARKVKSGVWYANVQENSFSYYPKNVKGYVFELFRQTPVTVYAVRVYDSVLTESEMRQNRFVDLAAYLGADISAYTVLSAEQKSIVADAFAGKSFDVEKAAFESELGTLIEKLSASFDMSDTLYVTDGLTVLLSAYSSVCTELVKSSETILLWQNAVTEGSFAQLKGTGWKKNSLGGVTIVKTINDYTPNASQSLFYSNEDYALVLGAEMLPEGDYTVEYVSNPVGITNSDGTRYVDSISKHGIYSENGVAIGPLRALQFACYFAGTGKSAQMERRWNYGVGDTPFADAGSKPNLLGYSYDYTWCALGREQILTTAITLSTVAGDHSYRFYSDLVNVGSAGVSESNVISPEEANGMFRLMGGIAGTIYSVRVYDRVLTDAEMAQNHFADLVYFYDIDISKLKSALMAIDDMSAVALAFVGMGFDMEKCTAQEYFDANIVKVWLKYNSFSVRSDLNDGFRVYYDVESKGVEAILKAGIDIEVGTLVNIGKNALPYLAQDAYDYKIVAFDSTAGKTDSLFVDDDTYAVTIRYKNAQSEHLLRSISCVGYVTLTFLNGDSVTYYCTESEGAPQNAFEAYYASLRAETDVDESLSLYLNSRLEACYSDAYIYLDASALTGGDGSEKAPYKDFEAAFEAVKGLMRTLSMPTHIYLSAKDGKYTVSKEQVLSAEDQPYDFCDLTILSENGGAVLTTEARLDGAFESLGNNLYAYRFEKDSDGNYPDFRYLYVDGKIATMAHSGGIRAAGGGMYQTIVDRSFEAVYQTAWDMAVSGELTFTSAVPDIYQNRSDLAELFEYYRPYFIAYAEVLTLYNALPESQDFSSSSASLSGATPTKGNNAVYREAFAKYQKMYLARYEAECKARIYKPRTAEYLSCVTDSTDALYREVFAAAKVHIYTEAKIAKSDAVIAPYEITVDMKVTGKELNKYYLDISLVGDLSDLMEEGRADMLLYADALEATLPESTEGLSTAEKNELLKKKQYISEIRDDILWKKHALAQDPIEMHVTAQYLFDIMHITGVDYEDYYVLGSGENAVTLVACYFDEYIYQNMQIPGSHSLEEAFYVYLQGCREYVDSENEYYYDNESGTLYYYSESGVFGKEFTRPTSDYLLKLDGVHGVSLKNISFTGVDDLYLSKTGHSGTLGGGDIFAEGAFDGYHPFPDRSALYLNNVTDASVVGCSFYELGCEGITARGWIENVSVSECMFDTIGSAAIRFGDDYRERVRETWEEGVIGHQNISITDNYLNNISTEYRAPALQMTTCKNGKVSNNTIKNTTYSAMAIGWNWAYSSSRAEFVLSLENVEISYNYVSNFMTEMADGGGIYVTGPNAPIENTALFNFMHHNYVEFADKTGDGREGFVAGIYFDGASSSWHCYENVVLENAYGAAETETDYEDYGISAEKAEALRSRRATVVYIYVQHIDGQETHNLFLEDNIILNVRATNEDDQRYEVYRDYLTTKDALNGRNVKESGTVYVVGLSDIPYTAARIIMGAGSVDHLGSAEDIADNVY